MSQLSERRANYYKGLVVVPALSHRAKWTTFFFNLGVAFVLFIVCLTSIYNFLYRVNGYDKIVMSVGGITTGILSIWLITRGLSRFHRLRTLRYKLKQKGQITEARLIGKQERELAHNPYYTIYYQFRPDFCLSQEDVSHQLYTLPIGAKLIVRYLPENPQIAFLEN